MPKYSTGGGGGDSTTCELCGAADDDLRQTTVAGADLHVCGDCATHGDDADQSSGSRDDSSNDRDRSQRAAQNAAKAADAASGPDPDEWVSGTSYEDDRLPYLVSNYDERVVDARQDAGLKLSDLAEEIEIDEDDLLAVEQGRAAQAGVGGSVIRAIEDRLGVELTD